MQPTYRPVRAGGAGFSIFLVCFALAAALTLGAWVYWKRSLKANVAQPVSAAERAAAAAAKTNNNLIARAANTLRKVDAVNKEGEAEADNMQQKTASATVAAAVSNASASSSSANGGPKLQGIFYNANNASALINGKPMKVGDEADGVKVLEITKSSVRVQNGSEVRELTMK
jgi:sRNA-binding protein